MTLLKDNKAGNLICTGVLLLLSFIANAQDAQLVTITDKQKIVIGEPLQYKVEATFPINTYKITWFEVPDSIAHFEVIDRQKTDTVESNGMLKVRQIVTLTSFDSGSRTIPPFTVNFESLVNDSTFNVLTDSVRINISFSPMDSAKTFHDIKSIILVKDEWPWWLWSAAGLSLFLLLFLVYYLFKKLRKKRSPAVFTSKLSPLEEAMKALDELQRQQLLQKRQVKQWHSALSEIFKRYISRKTNLSVFNLTSEEVLLRLTELGIKKEYIGLAANNLLMADAVKFAKYIPGNIDNEEAFLSVKKIIGYIDQSIIKSKSDS